MKLEKPTPEVLQAIKAGTFVGLVENLDPMTYHSAKRYYSNSFLSEVKKSPAHAKAKVWDDEKSPALLFGERVHMACLEPARFHETFRVGPDVSRATKAWKEAVEAAGPLVELLKPEEMGEIEALRRSAYQHKTAAALLSAEGHNEVSAFCKDPETGLGLRARFDRLVLSPLLIADLKTTTDASPEAFAKSIWNFGYHRQSALYLDVLALAIGERTSQFPHVCIEKSAPYAVAVYTLDDAAIQKGRDEYRALLSQVAVCEATGEWPAYSEEVQSITLPSWSWAKE